MKPQLMSSLTVTEPIVLKSFIKEKCADSSFCYIFKTKLTI